MVCGLATIDVLALDSRKRIYDHVKTHPGTHLRQVARVLEIPLGTALYHLDYLTTRDVLVVRQDGRYKRFFLANSMGRREKDHVTTFRHDVPRRIAEALLSGTTGTQRVLVDSLAVSRSTLSFHLTQMVTQGILAVEDRRPEKVYKLLEPETARAILTEFAASFAPKVPLDIVAAQAFAMALSPPSDSALA